VNANSEQRRPDSSDESPSEPRSGSREHDSISSETPAAAAPDGKKRLAQVPVRALLANLPAELRGDRWQEDGIPKSDLYIEQKRLLEQLKNGKVLVRVGDVLNDIPNGWLAADPEAQLELDLAEVVRALPPRLLTPDSEPSPDVTAAARLPEYFAEQDTDGREAVAPEAAPAEEALAEALEDVPVEEADATVEVPTLALLKDLPEELRGRLWDRRGLPDTPLRIPKADLLSELREGRVRVRLGDVMHDVPDGWLADEPDAVVRLDLPTVVASLPPDLLKAASEPSDEMLAAAAMKEYFTPIAPEPAEPQEAEPASAPEVVPTHRTRTPAPRRAGARRPKASSDWDGVTPSIELAPRGVDLNSAPASELVALAGVGGVRASHIIRYREENGRLESIHDLAGLAGIGPKRFRQMTGLSLRSRVNPYRTLPELLHVDAQAGPLLALVAGGLARELAATGCLLTSREGIPLAAVGELEADAARHAALGSHFLFKSERYLHRLVDADVECVALPTSQPPLLLLRSHEAVVSLTLKTGMLTQRRLRFAQRVTREIAWLLSRRAVVFEE